MLGICTCVSASLVPGNVGRYAPAAIWGPYEGGGSGQARGGLNNFSAVFAGVTLILGIKWDDHAWWGIAVFCGGFAIGGLILGKRRLGNGRAAAGKLVDALHKRWFPGSDAGLDARHRVSLWEPSPGPEAPKQWKCTYRTTTDDPCRRTWNHPDSRAQARYSGIVAMSAFEQTGLSVHGVPAGDRQKADAVTAYLVRSFISSEAHRELSFKFASLRTNVVRASNGTIPFVLLVEREDGEPIQATGGTYRLVRNGAPIDVDVCEEDLRLVADVWSAAFEEET